MEVSERFTRNGAKVIRVPENWSIWKCLWKTIRYSGVQAVHEHDNDISKPPLLFVMGNERWPVISMIGSFAAVSRITVQFTGFTLLS